VEKLDNIWKSLNVTSTMSLRPFLPAVATLYASWNVPEKYWDKLNNSLSIETPFGVNLSLSRNIERNLDKVTQKIVPYDYISYIVEYKPFVWISLKHSQSFEVSQVSGILNQKNVQKVTLQELQECLSVWVQREAQRDEKTKWSLFLTFHYLEQTQDYSHVF